MIFNYGGIKEKFEAFQSWGAVRYGSVGELAMSGGD